MKLMIDIPKNLYLFICENGILAMDILNSEERDVLAYAIQIGEVIKGGQTMANEIENEMEEYYKECDLRIGKLENDSDVPVSSCSVCFRYETCKNYYIKVNSPK